MAKGAATWKRVKFGEVVRQLKAKADPETSGLERYLAGEHMDTDDLRIRRWGQIGDGYLGPAFHMHFKPGQVLYGSRRTYLRKVAVAEFEGICANTTFVLESVDPAKLLPELLPFVMQTEAFHAHSKRESKGSVNPYVNFSDLAWFEFALPPLEEQQRLLAGLSAVEQSLQLLSTAQRSLSAVTRRLLESFDLDALPLVPVEELVTDGPRNGVSPQCNAQKRGRPTLPVGCVYTGFVNTTSDLKFSDIDDETFERFRLRHNDVLVVRGNGNRELVGRAGIVVEELSDCFYPDLLVRLRFDPARLAPALAVHLWNCVPVHASLIRRAKSTNGIYKINGGDIRAHGLPLPPKGVQSLMLDAVSGHARAVGSMANRILAIRNIKSWLLRLLAGQDA